MSDHELLMQSVDAIDELGTAIVEQICRLRAMPRNSPPELVASMACHVQTALIAFDGVATNLEMRIPTDDPVKEALRLLNERFPR